MAKLYPVYDRIPLKTLRRLGVTSVGQPMMTLGMAVRGVMAVYAGEKRVPRKGEWYLSGAEAGAYMAPNDLISTYHIARLVRVEVETIIVAFE